jgi:hypothetical protein
MHKVKLHELQACSAVEIIKKDEVGVACDGSYHSMEG